MVKAGDMAPEFELPDAQGSMVRLADLRGKVIVLYFYPRADTPGCTIQACAFRDAQAQYESADAVIIGVSPDAQPAQSSFASRYGLPFRLLCDTEHKVAEAYGTWVEKNNYGKKYMGIQRSTFVIDRSGKIGKVFLRVTVDGHSDEVLKAIRELE